MADAIGRVHPKRGIMWNKRNRLDRVGFSDLPPILEC
jgi:hypothetical protein